MKKNIAIIVRIIIFFTIFFFGLVILSRIFTPKWSNNIKVNNKKIEQGQIYTIKGFYELDKNSIDVLFLGDSSIYKGISPMEIYEETGITSYNYSISSARIYMLYYIFKDSLKYQKPKLVVMDTLTLFYKNKEKEPERRKSFDYMHFSKEKYEMINSYVFENDFEDKLSYIFPIFRYHSRWNDLNQKDITSLMKKYDSINKGFVMSNKMKANLDGWDYMEPNNRKVEMQSYVEEYFEKFVKLCEEENIELVLLGIPDKRAWNYESNEKMKELALKYNKKYLDMNNSDYNLNWNTDTGDGGVHLNILGAEKLTKEFTKFLKENYNFEDKRNNKEYSKWNDDLKKYNYNKNLIKESMLNNNEEKYKDFKYKY